MIYRRRSMGRQYNFYMGRKDEELFLEYLKQNQYVIYQDDKDGNPKVIDKWPEPYSSTGWFILYLYREDFGEMIFSDSLGDGRLFIHPMEDAPVIEFSRTCINLKDKGIMSGRIWLEMNYYDKNNMLWHKSENLIKAYNNIKKWIRKQLKEVDMYTESGNYIKGNFSEDILKLVIEEEYSP